MRGRISAPALALAVVAAVLPPVHTRTQPATAQGQPVFRGGVELVTVDVVVLDENGRPLTDLTAADFRVVAGRKPRTLVSVEFVPAGPGRPAPGPRTGDGGRAFTPVELELPASSTNIHPPSGRTFLFVVDVDEIRAGEGRVAMRDIGAYLDRLDPADRVGLVAWPYGSPRVDLTTDREQVKRAAAMVAGASQRVRDPAMTYGEAEGIRRGDTRALLAWWERTAGMVFGRAGADCSPPSQLPFEEPLTVPPRCAIQADRMIEPHRRHTRTLLASLTALAEAMAPIDGPKTLVLVSEGLLSDEATEDEVQRFAAAAERAGVALYALHLDAPLVEAAAGKGSNTTSTRVLDDRAGFDGMGIVAEAARGAAFRAIASATTVLERLDAELSGHYLLSFARDPADRDGTRVGIEVRVRRPGLDVRARREFTPGLATRTAGPPARPRDLRAAMGELLEWPVSTSGIGLDAAAYTARPATGSSDPRVILAVEIDRGEVSISAVGYEILDPAMRVVADTYEAPPSLHDLGGGRASYLVTLTLAPGAYRLKVGAIDRDGRRGAFETITVRVTMERVGVADARQTVAIPLLETADPERRVAAARLDLTAFESGEYRLTAVVSSPAGEIARRSRRFRR